MLSNKVINLLSTRRTGAVMEKFVNKGELGDQQVEALMTLSARLQKKYRSAMITGYSILALIALLAVSGGYIFWHASELASADLTRGYQKSFSDLASVREGLRQEIKIVTELSQYYRDQFNLGHRTLSELLPVVRQVNSAKGQLQLVQIKEREFHETGIAIPLDQVITQSELTVASDTLRGDLNTLGELQELIQQRVESGMMTYSDQLLLEREINATQTDLAYVENRLRTAPEKPVTALAQTWENMGSDVFGIKLSQVNINRYGTLLAVFVLTALLVPVYRYNLRLATHYHAAADAVSIAASFQDITMIEYLMSNLGAGFNIDTVKAESGLKDVVSSVVKS